eukprot:TRINITY_DN1116_c0_g1_i4.p1 TRINITY_DN1116_c0_g1~~TRINITY_DN1116_c0_g1_i4.p1  ORF type:complete len:112 (+),score=29.58 TRINITY_DN1116_c0_g1_i4:81-416(+)
MMILTMEEEEEDTEELQRDTTDMVTVTDMDTVIGDMDMDMDMDMDTEETKKHYKGAGRSNQTGANASAHYGVVASRADGKGAASFGKGHGVATDAFRKSDEFAVNGDEWNW